MKGDFSINFLTGIARISSMMDSDMIECVINEIAYVRNSGGRIFILGNGGSASTASHAVNDFRKIANIKAFTPTDNVSELTARINDNGWEGAYSDWLDVMEIESRDCVIVLSVGGGDIKKNVSMNLIKAIKKAKSVNASVIGITGRNGYTSQEADFNIEIPIEDNAFITPFTESMHSVILHLIVSHPILKRNDTKW